MNKMFGRFIFPLLRPLIHVFSTYPDLSAYICSCCKQQHRVIGRVSVGPSERFSYLEKLLKAGMVISQGCKDGKWYVDFNSSTL